MNQLSHYLGSLRPLTWQHILAIAAIVFVSIVVIRVVLPLAYRMAETAPSKRRLCSRSMASITRAMSDAFLPVV